MQTALSLLRTPSIALPGSERTNGRRATLLAPDQRGRSHAVREDVARYAAYEPEGSERRTLGSIAVSADARWMATLTVPIASGDVAFFQVERQGALPPGYSGSEESAAFSVPIVEVDALVGLLAGIVAQARQTGVLPAPR